MFQILIESEVSPGIWHPLNDPYKYLNVAVDEAQGLASEFSAYGHIVVEPVEV